MDVINTDRNMPEMSGFDFMRSMPDIKDTPVLVVTTNTAKDDIVEDIRTRPSLSPVGQVFFVDPPHLYTKSMHLRSARLCLDCDEVHDAQRCPHCASETFAFITRWVPVPDRPDRPQPDRPDRKDRPDRAETRDRSPEPSSPETLGAYREMLRPDQQGGGGKWKTIRRGAVGLALFGIAGWLWRHNNRPTDEADQTSGNDASKQQPT